ncbi:glycosyltransferase family 1 protein [Suttonella sp. R2A3]|uniref:glycosyltransferase family 4 protein n=1 Tax=Suttonella sp. R2A3 TaxID=2908648 RepID=UPI001F321E85|nr:glycosyltransferase family 1 protein [Suttonella sp. R2A3]UJF25119.1 glycosyltransferase family 1 protein [Suttonella sp. R2A3]
MNIAIVSDAWHPQVNGVVRTLTQTRRALLDQGDNVLMITPDQFRTWPCPTYPEIRLARGAKRRVATLLDEFSADAIHIATEGPLGWAARRYCLRHKLSFTTAYHTRFPEYIHTRFRLPLSIGYAIMRLFHKPSVRVMVPTEGIGKALNARGIEHTVIWGRGVDTARFYPGERNALEPMMRDEERARPTFVYIGRVAPEKSIEAFLKLDLPGSKWVIGDGPAKATLEAAYPEVHFLGAYPQKELPPFYRAADVFVFPSKTDTFGLVLLEAMACGTPVAAYPVEGPIDVISDPKTGALNKDLAQACLDALALNRDDCAEFAAAHSWLETTLRFRVLLEPFIAQAPLAETH